jgi:hypothetical protein
VRLGRAFSSFLILLAAAVVVSVGVIAWLKIAPRRVPPGQPALATLDSSSLPAFRNAFNAADGDVRVLVMLSPT